MFFKVAAPGKRFVAVLARVRVGVVGVGRYGCCGGGSRRGGRGVRRRRTTVMVMVVVLMVMVVVERGTGPAVARGAAVRRRVILRHGRAPRRCRLFGAHLARAAQRFCKTTTKTVRVNVVAVIFFRVRKNY